MTWSSCDRCGRDIVLGDREVWIDALDRTAASAVCMRTTGRILAHAPAQDTPPCVWCGEPVYRDSNGLWHHTSDDAVICDMEHHEDGSITITGFAVPDRGDAT